MTFADWIGSIGVSILLIAFFFNLLKKLSADSPIYILLNLIGAAMAGIASILINYVPFIILEAAWVLVSLVSLIKVLSGKKPG